MVFQQKLEGETKRRDKPGSPHEGSEVGRAQNVEKKHNSRGWKIAVRGPPGLQRETCLEEEKEG